MYRILLVEDDEALRYVYARMHAWQENGFCLAAQSLSARTDEDSQYALVRKTFENLGIPVQEDGFVHTLAAFLAAHLNGVITMEQAAEYHGLYAECVPRC